jgi:malate synthase
VALYNLMEDTATAEISRTQVWQWLHNEVKSEDGRTFNRKLYEF